MEVVLTGGSIPPYSVNALDASATVGHSLVPLYDSSQTTSMSVLCYESYKKHFVAHACLGHDELARSAIKE
jgi:hypothetical protein